MCGNSVGVEKVERMGYKCAIPRSQVPIYFFLSASRLPPFGTGLAFGGRDEFFHLLYPLLKDIQAFFGLSDNGRFEIYQEMVPGNTIGGVAEEREVRPE